MNWFSVLKNTNLDKFHIFMKYFNYLSFITDIEGGKLSTDIINFSFYFKL